MNKATAKKKPVSSRATNGIDGRALVEAVRLLSKEKGISEEMLFGAIEEAMKTAYKKNLPKDALEPTILSAHIDRDNGEVHVYACMQVVETVEMPASQIALAEAQKLQPAAQLGDLIELDVTPQTGFLRVAAQSAKQVLMQRIREAERGRIADEYAEKKDEIITAVVQRVDNRGVYVSLGHTDGFLETANLIPGEVPVEGDHIKVYVLTVQGAVGSRGPQVQVSRTHPNLVRRLFELEVPEILSGEVIIKSIAREAGSRTKIAVHSTNPMVDPVGACVGQRGARVDRVVEELKGEKIDIIKWSENPVEFVANALNPAHVLTVYTADQEKSCRVVVLDNQLSLAIGKEGQNARLAAKLTGWKIDIKSESQAAEMTDMVDEAAMPVEPVVTETAPVITYDPVELADDDDTL